MKEKTLDQLKHLPYFTKNTLRSLSNESSNSLSVSIGRLLEKQKLVSLKNGYYVTKYFFEKNQHLVEYQEFLASVLCQPSYLSLEYVLSKYDLLPEGVLSFTSVTLKNTRSYENKLGSFNYKKLANRLFTGYQTEFFGQNEYLIASKAEALFDYLYFAVKSTDLVNKNYDLVAEKRLRFEVLNKDDWQELNDYFNIGGSKMKQIKLNLSQHASNH